MPLTDTLRRDWLQNPRADILAGIVVALALIPEAIGFSVIAGVDPRVGLYASFSIAVIIAFAGGRPGMISAATAAVAVLVGSLVREHGVEYLFAATVLMGVLQVIAGFLRLDLLMQFVSRSVITGFVNALAILIFLAQVPQLVGVPAVTYVLVAAGLAIIYLFPRLTRAVPSPLVAIIVLTTLTLSTGIEVNTVGDMGGCAMIGQSVINVKSGGRTRLSTLVAGLFLLFLLVVLSPLVARIPMPSLVAVMIMVSIGTFSWRSIRDIGHHPWQSSVVMATTVVIVVWTHNLAAGVIAGVVLSGLFFASKVRQMFAVTSELSADRRTRTYRVSGEVFFASSDRFVEAFDVREVLDRVVIDVSAAHFWDITGVGTLDKVVLKFRREGTRVEITGLSEASAAMIERFATHDKPGADAQPAGH